LDYTKIKVGDIRASLIDDLGCDENIVNNTKGKSALIKMLEHKTMDCEKTAEEPNELKDLPVNAPLNEVVDALEDLDFGDDDGTGDFEIVDEIENDQAVQLDDGNTIKLGDPKWHEYVMDLFTDEELFNGNPTVDGLRRITHKLFGIKSLTTKVVQTPEQYLHKVLGDRRATVVVLVTLQDGRSFAGVGDSYWANTEKAYRNYPVSIAETRAEGRALKKALMLRRVNAMEEIGETIDHDMEGLPEHLETGPVTDAQIGFIDTMCARLNISAINLLGEMNFTLKELSHEQATMLLAKLNEYQQDMESIPDIIKGYVSNWRV